jgi:hypothetical protein
MLGCRSRREPPPGWTALLEIFLQSPALVARRLWHLYEPTCPLTTRYLLENALDPGCGAPAERILEVLTPRLLLRLTALLSPETGRPRDPHIVTLEGRILRFMRHEELRPWYA